MSAGTTLKLLGLSTLTLLASGCASVFQTQKHSVTTSTELAVSPTAGIDQANALLTATPAGAGGEAEASPSQNTDLLPEELISVMPVIDEQDIGETEMEPIVVKAEDLARFGDIWERVRAGFKMDVDIENPRVDLQRQWYIDHQGYIDRMSARATRYLHYTVSEAEKRGMPTELALLPVIESAYDPFAYSRAQAAGMWQFIPGTGKIFGLKQNWWYDGRRDIVESTRAAYEYLGKLYEKFNDWNLALASYNAGPGAVQRAIERNRAEGLPTDFWSLRLPAETTAYVPRFLAIAQLIKSPERYGVKLQPALNQAFFKEITTPGQIDLAQAAKLAGISLKELYQLNPGFSRWATDPEGPHRLLVPTNIPDDYETLLAQMPAPERVIVQHYRVKKGDNLFRIAKRFGLSPAELKRLNRLKSNRIPLGRELVVAKASRNLEDYSLSEEQRIATVEKAVVRDKEKMHVRARKGDTLWSIARKYQVNPRDLARWNGMTTHDHLRKGQKLTILVDKESRTERLASAEKGVRKGKKQIARNRDRDSAEDKVKKVRHEVRKGDTLFSIGRKYHVSVKEIRSWNHGSGKIKPGQDLVIYVAANTRKR